MEVKTTPDLYDLRLLVAIGTCIHDLNVTTSRTPAAGSSDALSNSNSSNGGVTPTRILSLVTTLSLEGCLYPKHPTNLLAGCCSGAIHEAGEVKARASGRSATSDWMELEKSRGISITSTAMTWQYQGEIQKQTDRQTA